VYSLGIDPNGTSQFFTYWNTTVSFWSSREWNGNIFAGVPEMTSHYFYNFEFVSNANASYFDYSLQDPTVISRFVLDVSGQVRQLIWVPSADEWMIIWAEPHQVTSSATSTLSAARLASATRRVSHSVAAPPASAPPPWRTGS